MKDLRVGAAPVTVGSERRLGAVLGDYVALTKPRLNLLVVITSAAGYYLGANRSPTLLDMVPAVAGTALVAAGSAALNQVLERETDALMRRTRMRPLPDGRIATEDGRRFGLGLSALGVLLLALTASLLSAALAVVTLVVYVAIYTPLKRRSEIATLVGAVPGALPPLIGWAAGHGSLSAGGWALFAIVFLWQIPHFMAIAWLFRDDYGRAGFPMLPVTDPSGARVGRQAVLYSMALLPASLVPAGIGVSGMVYFWLAVLLGGVMIGLSGWFAARRHERSARALFVGSILYLPLIWAAMILNH